MDCEDCGITHSHTISKQLDIDNNKFYPNPVDIFDYLRQQYDYTETYEQFLRTKLDDLIPGLKGKDLIDMTYGGGHNIKNRFQYDKKIEGFGSNNKWMWLVLAIVLLIIFYVVYRICHN